MFPLSPTKYCIIHRTECILTTHPPPPYYRKARRKERESPAAEQEHKLYLEEAVLERKIPETDLRQLVELPPGLGYHEWLASHSEYTHLRLIARLIAAPYCCALLLRLIAAP